MTQGLLEGVPVSGRRVAPSRFVAIVLTLVLWPGAGHIYAGQTRRGWLWGLVPLTLFFLFAFVVVRVPVRAAYGGVALGLSLAWFLSRIASAFDLYLLPKSRLACVSRWRVALFWVAAVAYWVSVSALLRTFIIEGFKIPSGSMQPTLLIQDHLFVDKRAFHGVSPNRGDLAVFVPPEHPDTDLVKRVVGLPGDRVEVHDGHLVLNGTPVPYCKLGTGTLPLPGGEAPARGEVGLEFLDHQAYLTLLETNRAPSDEGPWLVAPGEVFVIGDNRFNSPDSRSWFRGQGGGLPVGNLVGRPLFLWLSFTTSNEVDWSRLNLVLDEPHLPNAMRALEPALRECCNRYSCAKP